MRIDDITKNKSLSDLSTRILPGIKSKSENIKAPNPFAERPVPTIFHEHWWLEIASQGNYRTAAVSSDGSVTAWLPYILSKKPTRQSFIAMPAMTHVLGPALTSEIMSVKHLRSLRQFKVIRELVEQLPDVSHTQFQLHGGLSDTLAFDAAGFTTSLGYSTEIAPDYSENLWAQMRDKTRNVIRRAEEQCDVIEDNDPDLFLDYYEENLRSRGLRNTYNRSIGRQILEECLRRRSGRILRASARNGETLAAIFTIWDNYREYFYMSSRKPTGTNGVISLLIWNSLKHASERGLIFDSDGLNKNNFTLLTGFGGCLRARYTVHKSTKLFRAVKFLRDATR